MLYNDIVIINSQPSTNKLNRGNSSKHTTQKFICKVYRYWGSENPASPIYKSDCGKVSYANIRLIIVSITEFQEILKAKASFIDHVLNWWSRQKKTLKYPVDSFVKLCRNDSGHLGFSISAKLRRITYIYQMIIQGLWRLAPLSTLFQLQCISWWSVLFSLWNRCTRRKQPICIKLLTNFFT